MHVDVGVFEEDGQVVAMCVDEDIVAQADTTWGALYELGRMTAAYEQIDKGIRGGVRPK